MSLLEALVLGVVQGLTEFLPISSSGHLELGHYFFGGAPDGDNLLFDVVLHVGTLVAVFAVFGKDILKVIVDTVAVLYGACRRKRPPFSHLLKEKPFAILGFMIVLASIPTGLIGICLGGFLTTLTTGPLAVGIALIINGAILLSVKVFHKGPAHAPHPAGASGTAGCCTAGAASQEPAPFEGMDTGSLLRRVLMIGIGQGIAVTRGISRSGTTISLGILYGLKQDEAARFSFMLSIPAILGALVLELGKGWSGGGSAVAAGLEIAGVLPYLIGFVTAALVGYLALRLLLGVLKKGGLHYFAIYSFVVGMAAVVYSLV